MCPAYVPCYLVHLLSFLRSVLVNTPEYFCKMILYSVLLRVIFMHAYFVFISYLEYFSNYAFYPLHVWMSIFLHLFTNLTNDFLKIQIGYININCMNSGDYISVLYQGLWILLLSACRISIVFLFVWFSFS